jgi:hypothetical protein
VLEPVTHPVPVRLLNGIGAGLRALGVPLVPLSPKALKARAVRMAGLSDFGEADFDEALAVLCRSTEEDARLCFLGRMAARDHITNSLVTRLRRIEARKRRPEVFKRPLVPPFIILGMPRAGTTFLHRLLCLHTDARPLVLWEVQRPLPGPGPDRRREETLSQVARIKKAAPGIDAKHHFDADEPEEDIFLLDSSLLSLSFWMMLPVYGYLEWLLTQDQRPAYRAYREHLQLFQADSPDQRLTLKAPAHGANLEALLEAIPEALIIQTHRDPVPVVSSTNSLFYTIHGLVTDAVDVRRMAATNTEMLADGAERSMAARSRFPSERIVDVRYDDLLTDPVGTVRRIYRHFGLDFDTGFEARLREGVSNRPQEKFGRHDYRAEDFGMTDAQITERFKAYQAQFLNG